MCKGTVHMYIFVKTKLQIMKSNEVIQMSGEHQQQTANTRIHIS